MKNLLFYLILVVSLSSCLWEEFPVPFGPCIDCPEPQDTVIVPPPPDSIVLPPDSCEAYTPIDTPLFIQGYGELDNPINAQGWVLNVGQYTDTVFPGEESLIDDKLDVLISAFIPQYPAEVFARSDARRLSVLVKGTTNQLTLQLKVWIRADGAKWYLTFNDRGFLHGGSMTGDQFIEKAGQYPSMKTVNFRAITEVDSIKERKCKLAALGICKAPPQGSRVDFRFDQWEADDSLVTAFVDAGWDQIWNNAAPGEPVYSRGVVIGKFLNQFTVDTRGHRVNDDQILYWLNQGFQVVTDL
jgi:hypothetical protein